MSEQILNEQDKTTTGPVMTLDGFLEYSRVFNYSKEYYDIMKESLELKLMEFRLESELFRAANAELLQEGMSAILFESLSEDVVTKLEESVKEKATALKGKTVSVIKTAIKAIKAFFAMILKKLGGFKDKGAEVLKHLDVKTVTDDDKKKINELLEKAISTSGVPLAESSSNVNYPKKILTLGPTSVADKIGGVLMNKITVLLNGDNDFTGAMTPDQVANLTNASSIMRGDAWLKSHEAAMNSNSKPRGVVITLNHEELDKAVNNLEATLNHTFEELGAGNPEVMGKLQKSITATINLYKALIVYQQTLLFGLARLLGGN